MPTSFEDVDHLLRRAGFGGSTAEIQALMALDWAAVVEHVLDVSTAPSASVGLPNLDDSRNNWHRYIDMVQFWTERARTSPCPIQEKMTLFWHGHLCSSINKVQETQLMFAQNQLFRSHGLGNYEELLQQASVQPAMLRYLDNESNESGSPNENFARELMELFTLGVGHYSEDDVRESARAWTGHGLTDNNLAYEFHPAEHDYGSKTFMGVTQDWDGPQIISHLLNGSSRDQVAVFISTKVWEFFAYASPDTALVNDLASAYAASNLNTTVLLRAMFLRPEFRSQQCRQGLVRGPMDYLVSLMRRTGAPSTVAHPEWSLEPMGQGLFRPPNVAGWKQNAGWISPSNVWGRHATASTIRWFLIENSNHLDDDSASDGAAVEEALQLFGIYQASAVTRSSLEQYCASEPRSWARRAGLLALTPLTAEFQMA